MKVFILYGVISGMSTARWSRSIVCVCGQAPPAGGGHGGDPRATMADPATNVGRLVITVCVWLLFSGYMWWNLLLCEQVGRFSPTSPDTSARYAVGLYLFLGGLAWGGLLVVASMVIARVLDQCFGGWEESNTLQITNVYIGFWVVITYALLASVTFQDPIADLRRYEMNLKAFDYGSLGIVGCYQDNATDPRGLTIEDHDVWVYLADQGWTVDIDEMIVTTHPEDHNWRFLIAPIVYNGSWWNNSCGIGPPVYAVCVSPKAPSAITKADCGWELPDPLPYRVTIRKTRWGEFFDEHERGFFPYPPEAAAGNEAYVRDHRMFDFNAYSMFETQEFVTNIENEMWDLKMHTMYIWLGISLATMLLGAMCMSWESSDDEHRQVRPWQDETENSSNVSMTEQETSCEAAPQPEPSAHPTPNDEGMQFTGDGIRYTETDLASGSYRNCTIHECDIIDCRLVACEVRMVDFKGTCTAEDCTVAEFDVYGTLRCNGGSLKVGTVKPGGQLHSDGTCVITDVDGM